MIWLVFMASSRNAAASSGGSWKFEPDCSSGRTSALHAPAEWLLLFFCLRLKVFGKRRWYMERVMIPGVRHEKRKKDSDPLCYAVHINCCYVKFNCFAKLKISRLTFNRTHTHTTTAFFFLFFLQNSANWSKFSVREKELSCPAIKSQALKKNKNSFSAAAHGEKTRCFCGVILPTYSLAETVSVICSRSERDAAASPERQCCHYLCY